MSFPVVLHGPAGQEFATYTNKRWPLGTQLILQNGRKFRFAYKSAAAAVAGDVQQAMANTANHVGLAVQAATAAGARSIPVTLGGTAVAANEYDGGFVVIDTAPGNGYIYQILDGGVAVSAAGSETSTVVLDDGYAVQVALTTSSVASLIRSPYYKVLIMPTTHLQAPAGVAIKPIPASNYGWLQTAGPAAVQTQGTVVIGDPVQISGTTAGSVSPYAGSGAAKEAQIGWVMRVGATTTHSTIFLTLDH